MVMDVFIREAAVEPLQNKNAETVGRATKRAARELTGDDGNFVVTTDLGNEFATLDRELPEAVRRTKRPEDRNATAVVDRGIQTLKKDLATRVARKGGQWSDHFEWAAGAYNARPHETVYGAPEDVEKQPATEFRVLRDNRQVPAQQGPHRPAHEGGGGRGRLPSADERGEELQPSVRRRAAAGGRGLHDRPQHGGPGDPAEVALPAPRKNPGFVRHSSGLLSRKLDWTPFLRKKKRLRRLGGIRALLKPFLGSSGNQRVRRAKLPGSPCFWNSSAHKTSI